MTISQIQGIPSTTKLKDEMTGEVVSFEKYEEPYAVCYDVKGRALWFLPNRLSKLESKSTSKGGRR